MALQQHIDDLTREKYEMLRGMAGQRRVAETLEAENRALADDFNRQVPLSGLHVHSSLTCAMS
jgi:hypothetical protein